MEVVKHQERPAYIYTSISNLKKKWFFGKLWHILLIMILNSEIWNKLAYTDQKILSNRLKYQPKGYAQCKPINIFQVSCNKFKAEEIW